MAERLKLQETFSSLNLFPVVLVSLIIEYWHEIRYRAQPIRSFSVPYAPIEIITDGKDLFIHQSQNLYTKHQTDGKKLYQFTTPYFHMNCFQNLFYAFDETHLVFLDLKGSTIKSFPLPESIPYLYSNICVSEQKIFIAKDDFIYVLSIENGKVIDKWGKNLNLRSVHALITNYEEKKLK